MCVCVCVVEGRHAGTWRCWWQTTQSIQTRAVTICNVIYWIVCSGHAAVVAADAIYLIFVFIYAARTRGKIKCIRRIKRIIQMHLLLLRTSKMCQMANVRKEEEMFHIGTHTHTYTHRRGICSFVKCCFCKCSGAERMLQRRTWGGREPHRRRRRQRQLKRLFD